MLFWSLTIFACVAVGLTVGVHLWLRRRFGIGMPVLVHLALGAILVAGLNHTAHRFEETRAFLVRQISGLAPTFALEMERMGHEQLTAETDPQDPLYLKMINAQKRWLAVNSGLIADIYTFRVDEAGQCRLIVDSETDYNHDGVYDDDRESRTDIGESFGAAEEMAHAAMAGQTAFAAEPTTDRWGTWVAAYAPMFRADGRVDGVLGIDFPAASWVTELNETLRDWLEMVSVIYLMILGGCVLLRIRKDAIAQLRGARDAAESANRSKDEFLANMSHEIRTPMTAILGYSDLLMQPDLTDADRQEALTTIRQNGKHLLTLINDILDLSKVQAGKLHLEHIAFSPQRLVEEVASLMRVRAIEGGLSFAIEYPQAIPRTIHTDPTRLRQILVNLVGNAIKFTPAGSVRLRVDLDRTDPQHAALLFHVIDTGIGMSEADLAKLFLPFSQADASVTRKFGGTGLGLAICKRLAQLMDADLDVRSKPNHGSTFILRINVGAVRDDELDRCVPLINHPEYDETANLSDTDVLDLIASTAAPSADVGSAAAHDAPQHLPAAAPAVPNVLVAEDSPDIQALLRVVLQRLNVNARFVDNGEEALRTALAAHANGQAFPLILMDMQMPKMDGFHAAAELRRAGYRGPIVAMTAHAMDGDRSRCLEAGCTDYLSKPIDLQRLREVLGPYLTSTPHASNTSTAA